MKSLRHYNGKSLCTIFGSHESPHFSQGPSPFSLPPSRFTFSHLSLPSSSLQALLSLLLFVAQMGQLLDILMLNFSQGFFLPLSPPSPPPPILPVPPLTPPISPFPPPPAKKTFTFGLGVSVIQEGARGLFPCLLRMSKDIFLLGMCVGILLILLMDKQLEVYIYIFKYSIHHFSTFYKYR